MECLPSHFEKYNDRALFIFSDASDYQSFLVTDQYAVSKHSTDFCKFANCKYHIMLYSSNLDSGDSIIKKYLKHLTFTYFEVDAFYGLYKYFIVGESFILLHGDIMEAIQKAARYNRFHPHMELRPSILKKRLLRKKEGSIDES